VLLLQPAPGDGAIAGVTLPRHAIGTSGSAPTGARGGIPAGRGVLVPDPAWVAPGLPAEPVMVQVVMP
jgi:hypothetical protein